MRIYHDWEFLDDGVTTSPISVGMVTEDGHELYYEFLDAPWKRIYGNPWLVENVIPGLSKDFNTALVTGESNSVVKGRLSIRIKVVDFLLDAMTRSGKPLQLWGWYSAYDHLCLAQLFGKMIDLPDWCPMLTFDLKQEFILRGVDQHPNIPRQSKGLHNALEDAKHLKIKHEWFKNLMQTNSMPNMGTQYGNNNTQHNKFS